MTETVEEKKKLSDYEMGLDASIVEQLGFTADKELTQSEFEAFKKNYQELKQPSEKQSDEPAQKPATEQKDSEKPAEEKVEETQESEEKSEKPAEKAGKKLEEVQLVQPESNDDEMNIDEDWVTRYDRIMTKYAKDHDQEWKREFKDEEGNDIEGLKGKMGEAEIHFTSPDKAKANIAGIEALVNLAKETGQEIAYNEKWSDEFKEKMVSVCGEMGINIQGLPPQLENKEKETKALPEAEKEAENKEETKALPAHKVDDRYKINAKIAGGRLAEYALKAADGEKFEKEEVAKQEKQLAAGFYKVTGEGKPTAELLMKKYAIAMEKGDNETAETCVTALQRYGAEKIERVPNEPQGKYKVVEGKPYAERTDEEKARIDEAMSKALPGLKKEEKTEEQVKTNAAVLAAQKQKTME
ncbi:MAG: hypothetical protein Q4D11_04345 [Rhodospirillales bacterium]|nr:hypothetical protein [Rhodospirillales bacterium]